MLYRESLRRFDHESNEIRDLLHQFCKVMTRSAPGIECMIGMENNVSFVVIHIRDNETLQVFRETIFEVPYFVLHVAGHGIFVFEIEGGCSHKLVDEGVAGFHGELITL